MQRSRRRAGCEIDASTTAYGDDAEKAAWGSGSPSPGGGDASPVSLNSTFVHARGVLSAGKAGAVVVAADDGWTPTIGSPGC